MAKDGHELLIFLSPPSKCREAWFYEVLGIKPRASCMPGKHSTNQATSLAHQILFACLFVCVVLVYISVFLPQGNPSPGSLWKRHLCKLPLQGSLPSFVVPSDIVLLTLYLEVGMMVQRYRALAVCQLDSSLEFYERRSRSRGIS